ncbi:MAG: hypothetical protein ACOH2B_13375 [Burkholderiaceae bacterium]
MTDKPKVAAEPGAAKQARFLGRREIPAILFLSAVAFKPGIEVAPS